MKLYKTTVTFEILSDGPIPDGMTLSEIEYETLEGAWVGRFGDTTQEQIEGKSAEEMVYSFGSDPSFFGDE